jgi:hypothetical protein
VAAKLVECASCGAVVDVTEAAVDTDVTEAGEDTDQREETLVDQAPELIRFYCADCWAEGAGR